MANGPKPIGRIVPGQSMYGDTVVLEGCRVDVERLEGRALAFASYERADGTPGTLREPPLWVRAAVPESGGKVALFVPGGLGASVPAACGGDLVYLQDELDDVRVRRAREEVEAWKAERRSKHG